MIIVCEPQCKKFSHEKFNSGFIYGLSLAFPMEKIKFFADETHIKAIQEILISDNVVIDQIEYVPIKFNNPLNFIGLIEYYFLLKKIFLATINAGSDKVFFLSFNGMILYLIKRLKRSKVFSKLRFAFVLHGDFENIANDNKSASFVGLPMPSLMSRIKGTKILAIPKKVFHAISQRILNNIKKKCLALFSVVFSIKKMIIFDQTRDFRFIALSPHIIENARKYIDVNKLNMHTVIMPTKFCAPLPMPNNNYPKFAVFGYGNSSMLYQILYALSLKNINMPYEIRIIGMDHSGAVNFKNITTPAQGKPMSRSEMAKNALDIDMFLILYPKERYRLSCSGSIFEAMSYMKPILHFENECIDTFNTKDYPIGFCSKTVDEYANEMANIIINYSAAKVKLIEFRTNINYLRNKYSIENSIENIKNSFSWSEN
jgi:hypothetical protein